MTQLARRGFMHLEVSDGRFSPDGLRHATVDSPALGHRGDVTLWWPADGAEAPLPLVVLLHGVYGSAWAWPLQAGAHRIAAGLVAAGAIPPLVLAMPSDGLWGDGSGYLTLPGDGPDVEGWIADDVPGVAAAVAPFDAASMPACVAGLSMGGWGALRLGARRPDRFAASFGLSSITDFAEMAMFVGTPLERYGLPESEWRLVDALAAGRDAGAGPFGFWCGVDDPLIEGNRSLHVELEARGMAHTYAEQPGGHEWPYWERHLGDVLRFFAASGALDGDAS